MERVPSAVLAELDLIKKLGSKAHVGTRSILSKLVTLRSCRCVVLRNARLAYKTYGELSADRDNVVVLPTFYTGTHQRNEGFFGRGRAIDPARHFVVSINMFGNGLSSSPSNTASPQGGSQFPDITLWDNIACQYRLLTERFGISRISLVAGWSMAGCQAYQWAAQYPIWLRRSCRSARLPGHRAQFRFSGGCESRTLCRR